MEVEVENIPQNAMMFNHDYLKEEQIAENNASSVKSMNNQDVLKSPKDINEKYIHIGDIVHMLNTSYDGDHEWDDTVMTLEYVGDGEGDDWLVHGKNGAAWACECEVLNRKGESDGSKC